MLEYTNAQPAAMPTRGNVDPRMTYDASIEAGVKEFFSTSGRRDTTSEPRQDVATGCRKRWSYYVFRQGVRTLLEPG